MSETSIAALKAAQTRQGVIANNIANSNSTGFKRERTYFSTMVAGTGQARSYAAEGVRTTVVRNTNEQGLLKATGRALDLGIAGQGMLVYSQQVDAGDGEAKRFAFSRAAALSIDKDGNLKDITNGWYMQGLETNEKGDILTKATGSLNSLETINVNRAIEMARPIATSKIHGGISLPSQPNTAGEYEKPEMGLKVFDSLGVVHEINIKWEHSNDDPQRWKVSIDIPSGTGTVKVGNAAGAAYEDVEVEFDEFGNPSKFNVGGADETEMPKIFIEWTGAAADSTVEFDIGTIGKGDGITARSQSSGHTLKADGKEVGKFTDLTIADDGTVVAFYSNGDTLPIYKIPLLQVADTNSLNIIDGNLYTLGEGAGTFTLSPPNTNGMGKLNSEAVEKSTVDLAQELTDMMENQRLYASNTQVLRAYDELFQDLKTIKR